MSWILNILTLGWWERRCRHEWTRWGDAYTSVNRPGKLVQYRKCTACGQFGSRLVRHSATKGDDRTPIHV